MMHKPLVIHALYLILHVIFIIIWRVWWLVSVHPTYSTAVTWASASPEARLLAIVSAGRAGHTMPGQTSLQDIITPGTLVHACWAPSQMPYQVTPLWVHMQVLRWYHPAPLVALLVWLPLAVQTEAAVRSRRILASVCQVLKVHRSPSTVVVTILVPCAAHAYVTIRLVQQCLLTSIVHPTCTHHPRHRPPPVSSSGQPVSPPTLQVHSMASAQQPPVHSSQHPPQGQSSALQCCEDLCQCFHPFILHPR